MGPALGIDFWPRAVLAIKGELAHRDAAERCAIKKATASAWRRPWRRTGSMGPGRQGHPIRSKLVVQIALAALDVTIA